MDLKKLIPWLVILGGLGFGGYKLKNGFMKMMEIDVHKEYSQRALPGDLSKWGFAQYLRQSKSFSNEIALSGINKECESYVTSMEGLDLVFYNDGSGRKTYQSIVRIPSACSITDDWVASAEKGYLKACFFTNPDLNDTLSSDCAEAVFVLRAMMTQMLLASKRIDEITDLGKLTDLLYAEVIKSKFSPNDLPLNRFRANQIVDQMLEIDPNFKAAKRVKFFLKIQQVLADAPKKTLKEQNDAWISLQKQFSNESEQNTMEGFALEYEALMQTRGYDANLTLAYANRLMIANPNSAFAMLLSAYGHWKQDDHETALKEVRAVVMLAPNNKDYQDVQTQLSKSGATLNAFSPGLKLDLSPEDFSR